MCFALPCLVFFFLFWFILFCFALCCFKAGVRVRIIIVLSLFTFRNDVFFRNANDPGTVQLSTISKTKHGVVQCRSWVWQGCLPYPYPYPTLNPNPNPNPTSNPNPITLTLTLTISDTHQRTRQPALTPLLSDFCAMKQSMVSYHRHDERIPRRKNGG